MRIRAGREPDFEFLREIERAAGELFRQLGMDAVADDVPPSRELLGACAQSGQLWVAVPEPRDGTSGGRPVAYALFEPLDGCLHIEQITVHPAYARRRIGRALIEYAAERAAACGAAALTLSTFTDVPWNAPYYARCGFRALAEHELTPGLRKIRAAEAGTALDRWPRVCMRRELRAG